jgi:PAS domain S-box-containing protein
MEQDHKQGTPAEEAPPQALGKAEIAANLLDCIEELVVYHDTGMKVIWANKAAYDSLNLSQGDVVGRHCYAIWHQRSKPCPKCPVAKALTTGSPRAEEMVGSDGRVRVIRGYPIRDLDAKVIGSVGVTMDITDLKRAEQDLREAEESFRTLLEQSLQGIFLIQDMRIVFANAVLARITGYTIEESLALEPEQVKALVHPDDQAKVWGRYASRISGEDVPHQYEFRGVRRDGSIWWAEMYSKLITYKGKPAIQGVVLDITERKRAEQALRISEEQHRSLVENINEVIFKLDTQGRFTYISPVVERMLGYDPNRIVGQPFNCFVHPDDAPGVLVAFDRSVSADQSPHEFRVLAKDGGTHFARASCRPLYDDDRLMGLTGIMADITERKIAGAVLKESAQMYETLVRATTDAVTVSDLQGNFTEVSDRAVELFGYSRADELIGVNGFAFLVPEDHTRALTNLKLALKQGFMRGHEYTLIRKDGTRFTAQLDAALIRDAQGLPKAFIITMRDVTERKRAQTALRRSERRFKDIAEHASEWIWEVDANGVFTYSNPGVMRILGYGPEEVLGKHFYEFYYPEDRDLLKEVVFEAFATKRPFRDMIKRFAHKNGNPIWLSTNGVPILDDNGRLLGYRGADTDVTAQKRAEEKLAVEKGWLARTLHALDDGVIAADTEGKVVIVNRTAEELTGWKMQEAAGRMLGHVIPLRMDDDKQQEIDVVAGVLRAGGDPNGTGRAILETAAGGRMPITYRSRPLLGKDDTVLGFIFVFKPIPNWESAGVRT